MAEIQIPTRGQSSPVRSHIKDIKGTMPSTFTQLSGLPFKPAYVADTPSAAATLNFIDALLGSLNASNAPAP